MCRITKNDIIKVKKMMMANPNSSRQTGRNYRRDGIRIAVTVHGKTYEQTFSPTQVREKYTEALMANG